MFTIQNICIILLTSLLFNSYSLAENPSSEESIIPAPESTPYGIMRSLNRNRFLLFTPKQRESERQRLISVINQETQKMSLDDIQRLLQFLKVTVGGTLSLRDKSLESYILSIYLAKIISERKSQYFADWIDAVFVLFDEESLVDFTPDPYLETKFHQILALAGQQGVSLPQNSRARLQSLITSNRMRLAQRATHAEFG